MRILIVRHGDPDYKNGTVTTKGAVESELLSERLIKLDVKQFYCSPLGRARDTAKPTLQKLGREAVICDWLQEFPGYIIDKESGNHRIPWDLMPAFWTEREELYHYKDWLSDEIMQTGDVREKYEWVCRELDSLIAQYGYVREGNVYRVEKENRDTIVLFCHFGIECVMLSHILGISPIALWQGFVALPSSVTTLITEEREEGIAYFRCNGFGDISHLYAANEPPAFAARFCETYSNKEERH